MALYSPRRKDYRLEKGKGGECALCHPYKEQIICESKSWILIANWWPYNTGHVMLVTKRHIEDLTEMNESEKKELLPFIIKVVEVLRKEYNPTGFNIGVNLGQWSGGSVDHLHIHIVPRYKNDTGFTDIISGTSVVKETPWETAERLKKTLGERVELEA